MKILINTKSVTLNQEGINDKTVETVLSETLGELRRRAEIEIVSPSDIVAMANILHKANMNVGKLSVTVRKTKNKQ